MAQGGFFGGMNRAQKRALSKSEKLKSIEQLGEVIGQARQEVQRVDQDVDTLMDLLSRQQVAPTMQVKKGDAVSIGLMGHLYLEDGTVSETPFQGGMAPQMLIQSLGSGEMIPGFDEAVENNLIGSNFKFDVTFPADYREKSLAGKKANFVVVIHAAFRQSPTAGFIAGLQQEMIKKMIEREQANAAAAKKEADANGDQASSPA